MQHRPIEKGASSSSISIHKWMVVSNREMYNDGSDHWMDKSLAELAVGKLAYGFETLRKFDSGRGSVQ